MERPEMKLSCAISDGLEETYYLMDQNISTTANLDLTLLSDMMEKAAELCRERNVPLPKKVRIHADKATSETRNQTAFKWGALMVHRSIWTQAVFTYFAVGHSHGLPDQRFSVVRSKLTTEKVMETPDDFLAAVRKVVPTGGRQLRAQSVHSLFDFKEFLEPLECQLSGHTSTRKKLLNNEEVCHSFTLMTRKTFCTSFLNQILMVIL